MACEVVGGQAELARILRITPAAVSQWCNGVRPVPAERCPAIERATAGAVRCEDLRPDIPWAVLRERPAAVCTAGGQAEVAGANPGSSQLHPPLNQAQQPLHQAAQPLPGPVVV